MKHAVQIHIWNAKSCTARQWVFHRKYISQTQMHIAEIRSQLSILSIFMVRSVIHCSWLTRYHDGIRGVWCVDDNLQRWSLSSRRRKGFSDAIELIEFLVSFDNGFEKIEIFWILWDTHTDTDTEFHLVLIFKIIFFLTISSRTLKMLKSRWYPALPGCIFRPWFCVQKSCRVKQCQMHFYIVFHTI